MQVILYSGFGKRNNSTKTPPTEGVTYTGTLKDNCTILKPIIIFQAAGADDYFPSSYPSSYNYAYIDAFDRFYFVTEWEWAERNWIATLEVDPLATYKGDIGTGTHYVERCSGAFNGRITDTVYPVMTDPSVTITDIDSPWINETYYIVGISGGGGTTGITYYIFSSSQYSTFIQNIYNSNSWWNASTADVTYDPSIFNPLDFIKSIRMYRSSFSGTVVESVNMGYWSVPATCRIISDTQAYSSVQRTIALPRHPQTSSRGSYVNSDLYTKRILSIKPFGKIPLDCSLIANETSIKIYIGIDAYSGRGWLRVSNGSNSMIIAEAEAQIGVDVLLNVQAVSELSRATAIANSASSIISTLTGNGSNMTIETGVSNWAAIAGVPLIRETGTGGDLATFSFAKSNRLCSAFYSIADEYNSEFGRPYCAPAVLNTVGGFIKCANAEVEFPCLAPERAKIEAYLNGGFFYE